MSAQFNRSYELQVGEPGGEGISITQLHIEFTIDKTKASNPDTCTIKIYNLNEVNREKIQKDQAVILKAGYLDQGLSDLFIGTIFSSYTTQKGADIITTIQAGDGYTPLREKRVNKNYAQGTSVEAVIRDFISILDLPIGSITNGSLSGSQGLSATFPRGYTAFGQVKDEFDSLTKSYGLTWTIQAGHVVVIPEGETKLEPEVSVEKGTGLIGSPSKATQNLGKGKKEGEGVKFQVLLSPVITVGRRVKLNSKFFTDTIVRVTKVTHRGSYRGNSWTTQVEGQIINE